MALNKPTKRWHLDCEAEDGEYGNSCCDETIWADTKAKLFQAAAKAGWSYSKREDHSLCPSCNWRKNPFEGV